jgi:hypothetical protein
VDFHSALDETIPTMIKLLTDRKDEETQVAMIETVSNLAKTGLPIQLLVHVD